MKTLIKSQKANDNNNNIRFHATGGDVVSVKSSSWLSKCTETFGEKLKTTPDVRVKTSSSFRPV